MKKYLITILGRNFIMAMDGKKTKMGFYTTRYIESFNKEEAEQGVIDALKNEKELCENVLNELSDPPMLYVEEITELTVSPEGRFEGFTFFYDEE